VLAGAPSLVKAGGRPRPFEKKNMRVFVFPSQNRGQMVPRLAGERPQLIWDAVRVSGC
jgi:hypothetical protein